MPRRIEPFDVGKLVLLMNVDQHPVVERFPEARALYLARLEHGVSVRQDHGQTPLPDMCYGVERAGIEAPDERIVSQPVPHPQKRRIVQLLSAVALEGANIIGVAELGPPPV